ncbi:MAG: PIN domain-containing protein [Nostoc indistinguendum CM1-VF10]|nr:PIN domain-containing protein [Nostoc indistinguendum CM1-VF10]
MIPVSRQVLIEAAQLRASINIKLPDAIHAATALLTQYSTFLTNDQHFRSVSELSVILLSDINSP